MERHDELTTLAERGAEVLRNAQLVAAPTDTQYALCSLASAGAGVMRCYAMKQRPDDEPMPIFLPDLDWLSRVAANVSPELRSLAEAVWPGALSLVLRRNEAWRSLAVPAKTVAVRIPNHPVAMALLSAVGEPITGSSANRHGEPPAVSPDAVRETFGDDVTVLPTLGLAPDGTPSTILDCTSPEPRIVRAGAVDGTQVAELLAQHLAVRLN